MTRTCLGVVALSLSLAACGAGSINSPAPVPGAYGLATVDARTLPRELRLSATLSAIEVDAATLNLDPDGHFSVEVVTNPRYLFTCAGEWSDEGTFIVFRPTASDWCQEFRGVADARTATLRTTLFPGQVAIFGPARALTSAPASR